jgi:hypothetical protein
MVMQFHDQTPETIDKHLAYGIWFATIAAGYACGKFIRWLPGGRRQLAVLCCAAAFAYPAAASWQIAWQRYHAWPDSSEFISAFRPIAAESQGSLYMPRLEASIAEYYTPQGHDWTRWDAALSLDPTAPQYEWSSYYLTQLHSRNYGVIVLFYSTTFSSVKLPENVLLSSYNTTTYQDLLEAVGNNSGEPGLAALTLAIEKDGQYSRPILGRYDTNNISGTHDYGVYAIWRKKQQT